MWPQVSCLKNKRLHIRLRPSAEARIRSGHPWIFSDSIREQSRGATAGELAVIFDRNDQFLGIGLYDPDSPIRVRVVHTGKPAQIDANWWRAQLEQARSRRAGVFDSQTNGWRWINGESDGFPGLVLDQYAGTFVLKLYSAAWFCRLGEIVSTVCDAFRPERLVLRLSRNIQAAAKREGLRDAAVLFGSEPAGPVIFLESGIRFEADVLKGQKTGFFLDQRENRRIVGELAAGRDVLNAFSFSGGFSLYAARGGARTVTDIDISAHALESARKNFASNADAVSGCEHRLIQADVFEWLKEPRPGRFGLIVLDPPSLAKRETDRAASLIAYARLAESGVRYATSGGIVVCCSCSAHVRADEFFDAVRRSALRTGRNVSVLRTTREPADHHASFPEAEYLKAIYLKIEG